MTKLPPIAPAQISVFLEEGRFVFRLDDSEALYFYDLDTPGVSNCDSTCLQTWRPVAPQGRVDSAGIGDWNVIERDDGSRQWTHRKRPVYIFLPDLPGKTLGDGTDGLWHVLDP